MQRQSTRINQGKTSHMSRQTPKNRTKGLELRSLIEPENKVNRNAGNMWKNHTSITFPNYINTSRSEDDSNLLIQSQSRFGNHYLQRSFNRDARSEGERRMPSDIEEAIINTRGKGQPLDKSVRTQMESAFGIDLNDVQIHTNAEANNLNCVLNANAFTTGKDIFFRHGAYNPNSINSRKLIAHELTHVFQQAEKKVNGKFELERLEDKYEKEAKDTANKIMNIDPYQTLNQTSHMKSIKRNPVQNEFAMERANEKGTTKGEANKIIIQRQVGNEDDKTPLSEKADEKLKALAVSLKLKEPETNIDRINEALNEMSSELGYDKTIPSLSSWSKLTVDNKKRLLWSFVTKTSEAFLKVSQGEIPDVIPNIPLGDDLLLDVELKGSFEKPGLNLTLKWSF